MGVRVGQGGEGRSDGARDYRIQLASATLFTAALRVVYRHQTLVFPHVEVRVRVEDPPRVGATR